jgi:hypothetical protein
MAKIMRCIEVLYDDRCSSTEQLEILEGSDLVLEFDQEDGDKLCHYYFAHHNSRTIFWLDDQDLRYGLQEALGEITISHKSQYYQLYKPATMMNRKS